MLFGGNQGAASRRRMQSWDAPKLFLGLSGSITRPFVSVWFQGGVTGKSVRVSAPNSNETASEFLSRITTVGS